MRATLEARLRLPARTSVLRDPRVGWTAKLPEGQFLVLDDSLSELALFPLPGDALGNHGIAPDLASVALSGSSRIARIDASGAVEWEVSHPAWGRGDSESGCCWFSNNGHYVWATAPTETGPDEWLLIEAESGQVSGRVALACYAAGSHVVPHPNGNHIGLSVGEGQDGSQIYWGWIEDGLPHVRRHDDTTRVLVSISGDGDRFMTTPHGLGAIMLHQFPDGPPVASLAGSAVLASEDSFDIYGGFINEDYVLFASMERDDLLVASARDLDHPQLVEMPMQRAGNLVLVGNNGAFVCSDWLSGALTHWRVRPT